jgi:hypothetical protein
MSLSDHDQDSLHGREVAKSSRGWWMLLLMILQRVLGGIWACSHACGGFIRSRVVLQQPHLTAEQPGEGAPAILDRRTVTG